MKQVLIKRGKIVVDEISPPSVEEGAVLIRVVNSCVSVGTEISMVKSSGKSIFSKALEKPEKLKKVVSMVKEKGLLYTYRKIMGFLDKSYPVGYSISGIVEAVGKGVEGINVGDRVAAGGAGLANHAEYVRVPKNLVVKIPDSLSFEEASTVTVGAIALQGVRRADLKLGEIGIVFGTGLLGLLTVQLLRTSGVRVIAIDIDDKRLELAKKFGAELVVNPSTNKVIDIVLQYTDGYGADGVIFTASTPTSEPLSQAFKMVRKKGRVVLVGVAGNPMEIKREDLYEKELDFLISTSYGPGRYDKNYEEEGLDYPYAYVRWTENRNMKEFLRLISTGLVNVKSMIHRVYNIEEAKQAFEELLNPVSKPVMVLLKYNHTEKKNIEDYKVIIRNRQVSDRIKVALVGPGSFAEAVHLPNLQKLKDKFELVAIVGRRGEVLKDVGKIWGAKYVTTNYNDILEDPDIDLVFICTRHKTHAELTLKALNACKHVFVEKPLAINEQELEEIIKFFESNKNPPLLFVGFNRRFSRYAKEIKKHVSKRINPLFIRYRMNAGYIPLDHWVHEEGGRIIGEACHIIDLTTYLVGNKIVSICVEELTPKTEYYSSSDNKSFILKYEDGSVAHIDYFACGSKEYPKECMEVHFDSKTIVLDDYKSLKGYGIKIHEIKTSVSDKGHLEELEALYEGLKTGKWPIELWDLIQTTKISLLVAQN